MHKLKLYLILIVGLLGIVIGAVPADACKRPPLIAPSHTQLNGKRVVDWTKPTGKKYIDLTNVPATELKIVVDQKKQIINVYQKNKLIEQFLCSTGKDTKTTRTPVGKFAIQPEHGTWFYNNKPGIDEGARNFISFKGNGVYLFHSVVMNPQNQPIMSRQGNLGKLNSHGCIQMSLPDNIYFYKTFSQKNKIGTPVIIKPL